MVNGLLIGALVSSAGTYALGSDGAGMVRGTLEKSAAHLNYAADIVMPGFRTGNAVSDLQW